MCVVMTVRMRSFLNPLPDGGLRVFWSGCCFHSWANPNREDRMQNPQERAQANLSVVGACSVTDCRFNEDHECHAGQIEVSVGPDGAHCATYTPEASVRPRP